MDDKIYCSGSEDFEIEVFDFHGKKVNTIKKEYERIRLTERHKEIVHTYLKTNPRMKRRYDYYRRLLTFPAKLPAIHFFFASEGKLYVKTYRKRKGLSEVLILDPAGKLIKTVYLPVKEKNMRHPYPFWIRDGKHYQLYDNGETETWEIIVTDIKN